MPTLGDNSQGASSSNCSSDRCLATFVTASEGGTITGGGAYFAAASTAGTNAKIALYEDGGTGPAALVAASSGVAIPAGGGLVTFTISGSFTAGDYYLMVISDNFTAQNSTDSGLSGQDTQLDDVTGAYAAPPADFTATWSPIATYSDVRNNVYIEYTAAGGSNGAMMLMGVG